MNEKFTTTARAKLIDEKHVPLTITVNDRAATRAMIFKRITAAGLPAIERSDWAAHKVTTAFAHDWDYSMIAIHHIGQGNSCGPGALLMKEIQEEHFEQNFGDVGYHYGIDCSGFIFEGRDIRHKGSHIAGFNTGVIGIVLLENLTTVEEGHKIYAAARTAAKALHIHSNPVIPDTQNQALLTLLDILQSVFRITTLGGHLEYPKQKEQGKICPRNVGMELVRVLRSKTNLLPPPKK
jgi:hypothetical protein